MGDTPKRIAIIGAGQLGSRHLQGLTKIKHDIHITVIDPNLPALEIARQRFVEMPENPLIQSVAYLDSFVEFVQPVELAIIATNADVRHKVIEELMSKVVSLFEQYVKLANNLQSEIKNAAVRVDDPGKLSDTISSHLVMTVPTSHSMSTSAGSRATSSTIIQQH